MRAQPTCADSSVKLRADLRVKLLIVVACANVSVALCLALLSAMPSAHISAHSWQSALLLQHAPLCAHSPDALSSGTSASFHACTPQMR